MFKIEVLIKNYIKKYYFKIKCLTIILKISDTD